MRVMLQNYKALTRKPDTLEKRLIIGFIQGVLLEMMIPFEFQEEC